MYFERLSWGWGVWIFFSQELDRVNQHIVQSAFSEKSSSRQRKGKAQFLYPKRMTPIRPLIQKPRITVWRQVIGREQRYERKGRLLPSIPLFFVTEVQTGQKRKSDDDDGLPNLNSAMDSNKRVTRPSLSAEIGSGQSLGLHELPRLELSRAWEPKVRALRELIRKEDPSLVKLNVNWGISKSENNHSGCLELHCGGSEG